MSDYQYQCDGCGRIGNVEDGITGHGGECPDEGCYGRTYRWPIPTTAVAYANVRATRRAFLDLIDREGESRHDEVEIEMLHDYVEALEGLLDAHHIEYQS